MSHYHPSLSDIAKNTMTSTTYIGIGRSDSGQFVWWLTTSSGERIYNSEQFPTKRDCERAINRMKREFLSAPVMDISAHDRREENRLRLVA